MHNFLYWSVHRNLSGDQLMDKYMQYGLSNSHRQQDELLALMEPCSIRGGLEHVYIGQILYCTY